MEAWQWPWSEDGGSEGEALARRVARRLVMPLEHGRGVSRTWLRGRGAAGVAARAAAVAGLPAVVARLSPCTHRYEVLLAVGAAVGAAPPGDAAATGRALAAAGPVVVLLADADACPAAAAEILTELQALAPQARWCCTGRSGPDDALILPEDIGPASLPPPATVPSRAALLAWTRASLPGRLAGVPAGLVLPLEGGRVALDRDAAAALRARPALAAAEVAARSLSELAPLLALAEDAPLPRLPHPDDSLVLRWLSEHLADPRQADRAAAAAARLLGRLGQPTAGLRLLAGRRDPRAAWARGDLALDRGEGAQARAAWDAARTALQAAPPREAALLGPLLQGQARRLALRGRAEEAAGALREAQALARSDDDGAAVAAVLRATAEVAVSRGELLGAAALLDQLPGTDPADDLARAALALSQGDLPAARALLAEPEGPPLPLLAAHRDRRRAELALREGDHAAAEARAAAAAERYLHLGEEVAAARTWRLRGDVAAAAGDPDAAVRWWQEAAARQVRVRDLAGLECTLEHALLLEEEAVAAGGGAQAVVQALRDALTALGAGEEQQGAPGGGDARTDGGDLREDQGGAEVTVTREKTRTR